MSETAELKLRTGYILKDYRIEGVMGGGGFSIVYRAFVIRTKAKVVIKEFCPEGLVRRMPGGRLQPASENQVPTYQAGIRRFFAEASALNTVNHPNIVNVSNVFRANNTVYMIMDYEKGTNLKDYIKKHGGTLSERFMRVVFPPLIAGVDSLHRHKMLHLDIKPANILLRQGGRPLLLDFGAVQSIDAQPSGQPQTLTKGFAAIEQHNHQQLGPYSDVYGLGASMYASLTGMAPPAASEREKKDSYRPATRLLARRYDKRLLEAIDWALQLRAKDRPQTAMQLLLGAFGDPNEPITADLETERRGLLDFLGLKRNRS
ncbi:MAG: serine/threonine protein kinase [Gammaproteobacteria bacterium]|nr:serine/threonine protein kinase [Gammaproteobacteria bacterium]